MTRSEAQSIDAWTSYWRSGCVASCMHGERLEFRLNRIWTEYADEQPDGARLLDMATGNGVVARICAARAHERNIRLHITAVDAAQIDPLKHVSNAGRNLRAIEFIGGVRLEALPFEDGEFDGAVSQFGFEYADTDKAVTEVARVLAPGGHLRLVIHTRKGAISSDIGKRLERLQDVMANDGPLTVVLNLARAAQAGDPERLRHQSELLPAAAALAKKLAIDAPSDDSALFYSREFLSLWADRSQYRPDDLLASIENGWATAQGVAIRQEQMLRAALSEDDLKRLIERLAAAGLMAGPVGEFEDRQRGVSIAWILDATRRIRKAASRAT